LASKLFLRRKMSEKGEWNQLLITRKATQKRSPRSLEGKFEFCYGRRRTKAKRTEQKFYGLNGGSGKVFFFYDLKVERCLRGEFVSWVIEGFEFV
jgi:hypothetical protein